MNTRKKASALLAGLITIMVVAAACEKAEELKSESSDSALLESKEVSDEMDMMHRPGHLGKMLLPIFDACDFPDKLKEHATITSSGDSYPKTITITHEGPDGKGSAIATIVLSDNMMNEGAEQKMTVQREGKHGSGRTTVTIVNIGAGISATDARTAAGAEMRFSVEMTREMTGGHCKKGEDEVGGGSQSFTGELTMLEGSATEACDDDVFQLSGEGSASRNGDDGMTTLVDAVVMSRACDHPIAGTTTTEGPMGNFSINFGSGTCDSSAEVTRDGETKTVDLNEKKSHKRGPRGKHK